MPDPVPGSTTSTRVRVVVLASVVAAACGVALALPPIPQDPAYHAFADARRWLGVPNFQNVATNAPFLAVGAAGLAAARRATNLDPSLRRAYAVFFAAVAAVAFGSGWYHLAPTTQSLFWDRLPMSVAFGALCAALIGERLGARAGRALLAPLVIACVASVVWWRVTEERGRGDLRPYVLAQALPLICIVVLCAPRPRRADGTRDYALLVAWYVAAKLLETFDAEVFRATGEIVSGHALKHLAAAAGCGQLVLMLRRRAAGR
jgi:amino acid transporter